MVLTSAEIMQGATVGVMRQIQNLNGRSTDAHGCPDDFGWQAHIEGALGEMAFAKWSGSFWSGAHKKFAADVGKTEVRTRSKSWYELIIHPHDDDDARFYLLTGQNGQYTIMGWITGKEAKLKDWWSDPAGGRPAYFVPQHALSHEI